MKRIIALAVLATLTACGNPTDTSSAMTAEEAGNAPATDAAGATAASQPAPVVEQASLSDADKGRVCRAAIASLNGRDPAIIRVISTKDDIHRVRYTRDDGTVWTNECRVGTGTAEWRMVQDGQPGRWRNEDTIRFTVDGSAINIQTFMGGEPVTNDTYEVE
jgi:hypothetical protein